MKLESFLIKLERSCVVLFTSVIFLVFFLNKNFGVDVFFELPRDIHIELINTGILGLLFMLVFTSVLHTLLFVGIAYLVFLEKKIIGAFLWALFFLSYLYGFFIEPLFTSSGGAFLFVLGLLILLCFLFFTVRALFSLRKKKEIVF